MNTAKQWLLTKGNQFVVVGEFRETDGKVVFGDERGNPIPVPVWAIVNMLEAYKG
jgi:hypothetical protein